MRIKIDDKDIKKFERELKAFAHRVYPFATKATVNTAAFLTQKVARITVNQNMITRNKFTTQSIQVDQARTLNVNRQEAIVGSTAGYMEDQEFGATKVKKGKEGVIIPTSFSSGEGKGIRRRLPRGANNIRNIKLRRRLRGKSKKQKNGFKIWDAIATRKRFVFLDLGRKKGIFRVIGGTRANTEAARLKMVVDMSEQSVTIPRNPWLKPNVDRVALQIPSIYKKKLAFQLKRAGLFDGV